MSWDFDDNFVAGEYVARTDGRCDDLILRKDHSFVQEKWFGDRFSQHASGTWSRFGEGGVGFSSSFLGSSAEAVLKDNVYGMLDNTFGVSHTDDPAD